MPRDPENILGTIARHPCGCAAAFQEADGSYHAKRTLERWERCGLLLESGTKAQALREMADACPHIPSSAEGSPAE